ncbi:MAG: hypothetical protein JJT96_12795 [Opitutales bacterium]|nr:hypothetical protein [Opitutales bacterium]
MKTHLSLFLRKLENVWRLPGTSIHILSKLFALTIVCVGLQSAALSAQSGGAYLGDHYYTYDELVAMAEAAATPQSEGQFASLSTFISPVVVWSPETPLLFGDPLNGTDHLNARAYDPTDIGMDGQPLPGASPLPGTFVYNPEAGTVLPAGPHSLSLVFAPENFGKYAIVTANRTVTVNRMVPVINWIPATLALTYGEPTYRSLYDLSVNRPANLGGDPFLIPSEGSITFDVPLGTLLPAGEHPITVTFTPVDQAAVETVTQTIIFTVHPYPTDLSWMAPANQVYEFELEPGLAPLNASASFRLYSLDIDGNLDSGVITPVNGIFTYFQEMVAPENALSSGQRLNAGTHTLLVEFIPADGNNFTEALDTTGVSFEILPKDVAISFSIPSNFLTIDDPVDVSVFATTDANPRAANGDDVPLPLVFSISTGGTWAQITPEGVLSFTGWPADGDISKTFTVQVEFAGSSNYNSATASDTASLDKVDPMTGFGPVPTDLQWQCETLSFDLAELDINDLTPDWSIESGPASLAGSVLTFSGAGEVIVGWDVAETDLFYGASGTLPPIVVARGNPMVSWTGAADVITFGDDLSSVLVAVATCPDTMAPLSGSIVYTSGGETVAPSDQLDAGTRIITATFTPDATDDWNTASAAFELTVNPFPLELTVVSSPAPVTWYRYEGLTVEESLPLPVAFQVTSNDPTGSAQLDYNIAAGLGSIDPLTQVFSFVEGAVPGTYVIEVRSDAMDSNFVAAAPVTVQFEVLKSRPLLIGGTSADPLIYGKPIQKWFMEAFEARELIVVRDRSGPGSREFFTRKSVNPSDDDFRILLPVDLALWNLGDVNAFDPSSVDFHETEDLEPFWVEYANFPLSRQYLQAGAARNFTVILIAEKFDFYLSVSRLGNVTVEKAQPTLSWEPDETVIYENLLGDLLLAAPSVTFAWTDYTGIFPDPFNRRTLNLNAAGAVPDVFGSFGELTFNILDETGAPIMGLQNLSEEDFASTLLDVGDYTIEVIFDAGPIEIPASTFATSEAILFNGNNFEQAVASVDISILPRTPIVTLNPLPDLWTTSEPINLLDYVEIDALSGSGLTPTFTVVEGDAFVALAGSTLTPVGWMGDMPLARNIVIEVNVDGNSNYNDALPVSETLSLSKVRQEVTLSTSGLAMTFGCGLSPIEVSAVTEQLEGPLAGDAGGDPLIAISAGFAADVVSVSPSPGNPAQVGILNAGDTSLTAEAPDSLLFTSAEASIPVSVAPYQILAADVVWNPADLVYPEALNASGNQFNAQNPTGSCGMIGGGFAYSPAENDIFPAGTLELTAVFTPDDSRNYIGLSLTRTISVEKGTPVVTLSTLPDLWTTSGPIDLLDFVDIDALPGSGLVPSFTVVEGAAFVDLDGSTLTPVGWMGDTPLARNIQIQVNVDGNANYNDALPVSETFSLSKVRQEVSLSLAGITATFGCGMSPVELSASSTQLEGPLAGDAGVDPRIQITAGSALDVVSVNPSPGNPVQVGILNAGDTDLTAGAADSLLFVSADASIPVSIAPYQIVATDIVWNPANLVYPEALNASGNQFNAQDPVGSCGSIAGSFAYSPAGGAIYAAGSLELTAAFTPADSRNYIGLSVTRTITVEKGTPVITLVPLPDIWTTSAPIDLLDLVAIDALPVDGLSPAFTIVEGGAFVDLSGTVLSPVGWTGDAPLARTIGIRVDVAGNANYNDAEPVSDSLSLSKVRQEVSFSVAEVTATFGCGLSPIGVSAVTAQLEGPLAGDAGSDPLIAISPGSAADVVSLSPSSGNPVDLAILNAGSTNLTAEAPDSLLFVSADASIPVSVAPYQIVATDIVWDPADLVYPEALNATGNQFNAQDPQGPCGTIAGSFAYSPAEGVIYPAGTLELTAEFTPDDTRNYASLSLTRTVTIQRGSPVLEWDPEVTTIIYLETLDFSGVNAASADVDGGFAYRFEDGSDAEDVVLPVGSYEVFAHFVPDDTDNYDSGMIGPITFTVDPRCFQIEFLEAIEGALFDPTVGQIVPLRAQAFYLDPEGNRVDPDDFAVTFNITRGANLANIVTVEDEDVTVDPDGDQILFFQRGTVGVTVSAEPSETDAENFLFCANTDFPHVWTVLVNKIPVTITWDWRGEGTADDLICVMQELTSDELNARATFLNQEGERVEVPGSYIYLPDVGAFFSSLGEATVELNFIPQDIVRFNAVPAQKTVLVIACDFATAFDDWAASNGLPPTPEGVFDPLGDSSGNGTPDVIAFAMGLDPFSSERHDPLITVVDGKIRITYTEAEAARGLVTFTIEGSATLSGFAPVPPAAMTEIERVPSGALETVTLEIDDPTISFIRLSIGF